MSIQIHCDNIAHTILLWFIVFLLKVMSSLWFLILLFNPFSFLSNKPCFDWVYFIGIFFSKAIFISQVFFYVFSMPILENFIAFFIFSLYILYLSLYMLYLLICTSNINYQSFLFILSKQMLSSKYTSL